MKAEEKEVKKTEEPKKETEAKSKEEKPVEEAIKSNEIIDEDKRAKRDVRNIRDKTFDKESWQPKTGLGKQIKEGEITSLSELLDEGMNILESEIIDILLPNMETDLLLIGQSKGKFGGGKRRVFRQTQKKTQEGNKPKFGTVAIIGNKNGFVGTGYGKSKETVPAREKSLRNAKLNVIKIRRGCGSWKCGCGEPHTIPFKVRGKSGSSIIELMPAPRGTGLKIEKECGKILELGGISDVWSKTFGQTKTKINLIKACFNALKQLSEIKVQGRIKEELKIIDDEIKEPVVKEEVSEEIGSETSKIESKAPKSTNRKFEETT